MPIRTGNCSARCAATAASTAQPGEPNAAHTPSPGVLEQPAAVRLDRRAQHLVMGRLVLPASHSRRSPTDESTVDPSTSVNRNVTTPDGGGPAEEADTRSECHNGNGLSLEIVGMRPQTSMSARTAVVSVATHHHLHHVIIPAGYLSGWGGDTRFASRGAPPKSSARHPSTMTGRTYAPDVTSPRAGRSEASC